MMQCTISKRKDFVSRKVPQAHWPDSGGTGHRSGGADGLRAPCPLMADKITTVRKARIGSYAGRLADEDIVRLNRAVLAFLGIASPTAS